MLENRTVRTGRDCRIDFIRGIGIILVVFGHCIQWGSGTEYLESQNYFQETLFRLIYSFHMPLLAIISGFLFHNTLRHTDIIMRRIKSLLIPCFSWITIEMLLRGIFLVYSDQFNFVNFLEKYVDRFFHGFWFIWAIFWISLIAVLIEKVFKGRDWIYILFFSMMIFEKKHATYTYLYPYFVAGLLSNKYYMSKMTATKHKWPLCFILSFIVFSFMLLFYDNNSYIYTTGISPLNGTGLFVQIGIDMYRYVIGFAGSAMVISLCNIISLKNTRRNWYKAIAVLGQMSLGIYILNCYFNVILSQIASSATPNICIWILEAGISLCLYYYIICIVKKLGLSKMLLGGR